MAFERIYEEHSIKSDAKLTLRSDGWSGQIVNAHDPDLTARQFQLDVDYETYGNEGWFPGITGSVKTTPENIGSVWYQSNSNSPIIVGISLEHMGWVGNPTGTADEGALQFLGQVVSGGSVQDVNAWGGKENENVLSVLYDWIRINNYEWQSAYESGTSGEVTSDTYIQDVGAGSNICPFRMICNDGGNWPRHHECIITTDLPIFETDADLIEFIQSGGTETSKMLNFANIDPEEEYKLDQKYYFLHNIFTHNYHGTKTTYWRNYRWKPGYDSKIRMYRVKPSDSRYYTLVLVVPSGLTRTKGPKGEYADNDAFEVDSDTLQTHYCEYSFTISRVSPKDVMEVTDFDTNIPIWNTAEDATKYANNELSIEDAANYSDILRWENEIPEPDWGTKDVETETGVNGQTYAAGSAIYVLSRSEMIAFFSEIFKVQDPTFINAFKDGNVLFGDNQANAIIGCMYFPFDASEVCSLESSSGAIWVGGWESQNATGKKVNLNDKVITIGSFQMSDLFKDVRDYEPYTNLFVQLPYCGTYQLSIQKYLNKLVRVDYAVDILTGACTALLFADGILMDSMDGMIGSQRPVTGRTAANILQAITRGSASVAAGTAAGVKGGMALAGAGEAVFAGGPGIAALGIGAGTQTAVAANALAASGIAIGAAGAGIGAVAGVDAMYKAKNAYADPPMATRGQYSGSLGMFANQKVHFIVAVRHTIRPENEINLIGLPSGRSGKIGSFTGYLKSSCVYLADGFIGSVQERNEILEMIAKGIYI